MAIQTTATKITDGDQLNADYFNDTGNMVTVEAGETIAIGDVCFVYMSGHANEGEAWKSDANTQDKCRVTGIAVTTGTDGGDVTLQTGGVYTETAAFSDKETYYLSATAGAFTTTVSGVRLGIALSANTLFLNIIQDDRDTIRTVKDVHIDLGTISNTLTAFWQLCDGTTISDAESPLNGLTVPDLNGDNTFVRAGDTSGGTGGGTHVHQWFSYNTGVSADGTIDTSSTIDSQTYNSSGVLTGLATGDMDADAYTSAVQSLPPFMNMVKIMKIK